MNRSRIVDELSASVQHLVQTATKKAGTILGPALEGIYLYGSAVRGEYLEGRSNVNLLLVLTEVTGERMRTLAPLAAAWRKDQVAALIVGLDELAQWPTTFPIETSEVAEDRVLLAGRDSLATLRPDTDHLAQALVRESRAIVVRLRQRYIEGGASTETAMILIALSVASLGAVARTALRLWDEPSQPTTEAALTRVAARLGLDPIPYTEGWAVRCGRLGPGQLEIPRLFDRYLGGLVAFADAMAKGAAVQVTR
ncbi:MAG: hypothetical protein U0172_04045 [Nitrospiraceae bacterium]